MPYTFALRTGSLMLSGMPSEMGRRAFGRAHQEMDMTQRSLQRRRMGTEGLAILGLARACVTELSRAL